MKKTITIFCSAFLMFEASAQTNNVASSGNATGTGGTVSYSILHVDYFKTTGTEVNNAIQQPFEIMAVTGIDEGKVNLSVSVYPNPTTDRLILTVNNPKDLSYELTDATGKTVSNGIMQSTTIIPITAPSGVYFVKVLDGYSNVKTFKVIKN